jgi:tetratricopeptide (TPR) repeat protein
MKLAELYLRAGRPAEEAVARLEPLARTHVPARVALARALLAAGDAHAAARTLVTTADDSAGRHEIAGRVHAAPRDPARRVELARAHALAGRRADAAREYGEAIAIAPALPAANVELALLDLAAGRAEEAVPLLERVVRSTRQHRQANVLLAEHYEGRGQPAKAIEHLLAAFGPHPPLDVRLRLASLHAEAGHAAEALARAEAGVAEAPRSAAAHATLAQIRLGRGDAGAAKKSLEDALAIGDRNAAPYLAAAFDTLGATYRRFGRGAEADAALARAGDLTRWASVRAQ